MTNEICECGHPKGWHAKEKIKTYPVHFNECIYGKDCPCKKFKPQSQETCSGTNQRTWAGELSNKKLDGTRRRATQNTPTPDAPKGLNTPETKTDEDVQGGAHTKTLINQDKTRETSIFKPYCHDCQRLRAEVEKIIDLCSCDENYRISVTELKKRLFG